MSAWLLQILSKFISVQSVAGWLVDWVKNNVDQTLIDVYVKPWVAAQEVAIIAWLDAKKLAASSPVEAEFIAVIEMVLQAVAPLPSVQVKP